MAAFAASEGDIASTYIASHASLKTLVRSFDGNNGDEHHIKEGSRCVDELGRLEMWDADMCASNGVLDHQLRRASHLHTRVLDLLQELNESAAQGQMLVVSSSTDNLPSMSEYVLDDGVNPGAMHADDISSKRIPPNFQQAELASQKTTVDLRSLESTSLSSSDEDSVVSRSDLNSASELHLQISDIRQILTLLFQLSPSLQDPAPSANSKLDAYEGAALNDQSHVENKFPNADMNLIKRLGTANWRRRKYVLSLRERYASQASQGNDAQGMQPISSILESLAPIEEIVSFGAPPTIAVRSGGSSVVTTTPSQAFGHSSVGNPGPRTEYTRATDYSSGFSPGLRNIPPDEKRYRDLRLSIPPPPSPNQRYQGRPFLCPYCLHIPLQIGSAQEWMRHVILDIEPYICTFGDCPRPDKTYGSRKDWYQHEEEIHRISKVWICRACQLEFATEDSFQSHMLDDHRDLVTREQVNSMKDLCRRISRTPTPRLTCPLCKTEFGKEVVRKQRGQSERAAIDKRLKRHIADELEQLALFAVLPTGIQHDDEVTLDFLGDSESDSDFRDEIASIDLHTNDPTKTQVGFENVLKFLSQPAEASHNEMEGVRSTDGPSLIRSDAPRDLSDETTRPDKDTVIFPIRTILHPRNEHFYGRDKDLHQMHQQLQKTGQICVVHGIGGVGKTNLAVQYAHTYQDLYDCVFWLQADTDPGLADSFGLIAENLLLASDREDQARMTDLGREWLQKTERRWLLIFDNCEDWDSVLHYMPAHFLESRGTILITTQDSSLVKFPAVHVSLRTFDQDEGSSMLLKYLQREPIETNPERELSREISSLVGGLPVAIAHVAGYMSFSQCPFDELLDIFKQRRIATGLATDETDDLPASFRQASFSYDETLAVVSHVTLRELPTDSQNLVYILAYLNCEAVSESMLFRIHFDASLEFLDSREHTRYKRMKRQLIARRLVQMKDIDGESCFYIHRSLARSIRDELAHDHVRQQNVFNQALTLVQNIFPSPSPIQVPEPEKWPVHQQLLPHVLSLRSAFYEAKPNLEGSERFARLLSDAGINQWERGITKEGLLILKTAEDVLNSISFDNYDGMRANIHAIVALMYDNTGISFRAEGARRRQEALKLRSYRVEQSNQVSINDETLLYNARMDFVISLLQYNRYQDAEPIINECLTKYREWGPEDKIPYEYAKYYHKMSLVRMYQSQYAEAIKLGELSVHWMGKTGNESLEYQFKFDLACVVTQTGDIQKALNMHKEIYQRRLNMCGRANEQTLQSRYAIGALYEILGEAEQAESWFKNALDFRRLANWAEEAVARTQYHLALVSRSLGKPQIANQLEAEAVATLERLLALDLPDCLKHVTDKRILFDHILTVCGARFTGQGLLELVR